MFSSYVAIGDSFTEGVGDELDDGTVRGWADRVASGLAKACTGEFRYANLAVRGRKLGPIIDEQLDIAIAMKPDLLSINGGGNDLMRPRVSVVSVASMLTDAVEKAIDAGIHVLLLSGANPSRFMPMGSLMRRRGNELATAVELLRPRDGLTVVDNWSEPALEEYRYWSHDRIHLNAAGHARVAANVLRALDVPVPEDWGVDAIAAQPLSPAPHKDLDYYRRYVVPWVGRRLTGRSSGDGRTAKIPTLRAFR